MRCIYFAVRSKKYQKYRYCRKLKKEIQNDNCKKCKNKEYVCYEKIKQKSNKLAKLEKKRGSILTNDLKTCYLCPTNRKKKATSMHEIYKGSNRIQSIKNNFCVPLCDDCHRHTEELYEVLNYLQRECQKKFEETNTREEFMKIIGRNFL